MLALTKEHTNNPKVVEGKMAFYFILAVMAGAAGVLQNGLNRKISDKLGLSWTIHLSNLTVFLSGLAVLTIIAFMSKGDFAQILRAKAEDRSLSWWYFAPGILGLFFVVIVPFTILKIGAVRVFIAIIAAQIIASLAWDAYVENMPVDKWRLAASVCAIASTFFISMAK